MKTPNRGPFIVAGFIAFVIVLGLFLGLIIQALWNQTVAPLFGVGLIGYWQSVGLFILAKIMFGIGTGSGPSKKFKKKMRGESDRREDGRREDGRHEDAIHQSSEINEPNNSREFQEYWAAEGKAAYEAFRNQNKLPGSSS